MPNHVKLAAIFSDTRNRYETVPRLREAVFRSAGATQLYRADDSIELPTPRAERARVAVSTGRTFFTARRLLEEKPERRVVVHNFASATNPGGGVINGSAAQEESLCRCSTLYPTLDQQRLWDDYYLYHREQGDTRYDDACIYSPGVVVFKDDETYPEPLPEDEWYTVDVITCAAPNLRHHPFARTHDVGEDELYAIHLSRAKRIFGVCAANGADALVLGAFGCGAFQNDPWVVARAYRDVLDEMAGYFEVIEFAVFCAPGRETENFRAFSQTIR